MEDKKKILTDWEKKEKRRKYMRKYYLKRKYQLKDGKFTRNKNKKPLEIIVIIVPISEFTMFEG